jgi:hypothetical protein
MRRIPPHLLHITVDDLPEPVCARLLPLLAHLPQLPAAADSAQLIGPSAVTLPALAVLARHIVQGLRDHNLTLANDRPRLCRERRKLLFFDSAAVIERVSEAETESVLCLADATPQVVPVALAREAAGLASFVSTACPLERLAHWRVIDLGAGTT